MLRLSERNFNYIPAKTIEEVIAAELKSGDPDWESIQKGFRHDEQSHVEDIKNYYDYAPEECLQTYAEILQESLMTKSAEYLERKIAQNNYQNDVNIDLQDPFAELKQNFDDETVEGALLLIEKIQPGALGNIVHVGTLYNSDAMGLFSKDYDNKVKNIYYSLTNPNIHENDILKEQKQRNGISLLINPARIKEEVQNLLPESYDENDMTDVEQMVLAEILLHEAVHANGANSEAPSNGEQEPVNQERIFLNKAVDIINNARTKEGEEPLKLMIKS